MTGAVNITPCAYSISVVIPNYNGEQLLQQNLPYIYDALNASGCVYEIIISDNASTDGSVAFIQEKYPQVRLITNTQNGGYSININRGIKAAVMDLVLLLNSDIKLNTDYFTGQLPYFDRADTFGVMGQVQDEATHTIAESCKYPLPSLYKINAIKNVVPEKSAAYIYTYYLSGANALVNREKLMALNGFNELFSPYYHEDLDLSLRAWENGWKCYYHHGSVCLHAVSSTIKKHSPKNKVKIISTRNKLMLHYLHLSGYRLYIWGLAAVLSLLYKWLGGVNYYKAFDLFLADLPALRQYKNTFIHEAVAKNRYIPFITIKKYIKNALDKALMLHE